MDHATQDSWSAEVADDKKPVQASREGLVNFAFWTTPDLRKAIRQAALEHDVTLQELAESILWDGLAQAAKHAKRIKAKREEG